MNTLLARPAGDYIRSPSAKLIRISGNVVVRYAFEDSDCIWHAGRGEPGPSNKGKMVLAEKLLVLRHELYMIVQWKCSREKRREARQIN